MEVNVAEKISFIRFVRRCDKFKVTTSFRISFSKDQGILFIIKK